MSLTDFIQDAQEDAAKDKEIAQLKVLLEEELAQLLIVATRVNRLKEQLPTHNKEVAIATVRAFASYIQQQHENHWWIEDAASAFVQAYIANDKAFKDILNEKAKL